MEEIMTFEDLFENISVKKEDYPNNEEYKKALFESYKEENSSTIEFSNYMHGLETACDIDLSDFISVTDFLGLSYGGELNGTIKNIATYLAESIANGTLTPAAKAIVLDDFGDAELTTPEDIDKAIRCKLGLEQGKRMYLIVGKRFIDWLGENFVFDKTVLKFKKKLNS